MDKKKELSEISTGILLISGIKSEDLKNMTREYDGVSMTSCIDNIDTCKIDITAIYSDNGLNPGTRSRITWSIRYNQNSVELMVRYK